MAEAPELMPFSVEAPLSVGRSATLVCNAFRGDPPLTLVWSRNGRPVEAGTAGVRVVDAGFRTSVLTIEAVTAGDSGEYTCTATNEVGEASHTARLTVKGQSAAGDVRVVILHAINSFVLSYISLAISPAADVLFILASFFRHGDQAPPDSSCTISHAAHVLLIIASVLPAR